MTTPNVVNAGEKPKLLNYLLRVMTSDGHIFEIDGNKDFSIAVYSARYSSLRYTRTSEHPIGFPNITDDEMRVAGNVMEEFADLIMKSAIKD